LTSRRKQIGGGGDEPVQTRDDPGPRAVSFVDAFRLRHVLRPAAKRALLFSALAGVRRGSTPGEASRVLGARSRELLPCLRERKWCRRGQRRANRPPPPRLRRARSKSPARRLLPDRSARLPSGPEARGFHPPGSGGRRTPRRRPP